MMAGNPGCMPAVGSAVAGPEEGIAFPRAVSTAAANGWANATPAASIAMPIKKRTVCMNCDMLSPLPRGRRTRAAAQ
jgi:hypothetical protein